MKSYEKGLALAVQRLLTAAPHKSWSIDSLKSELSKTRYAQVSPKRLMHVLMNFARSRHVAVTWDMFSVPSFRFTGR